MRPRRQLDLTGLRVLDGGLATELEAAGCDISGPLWSGHVLRDHPERIEAVHMAYLLAGADCISTSSYQLSREGFREIGLSDADAIEAMRLSVHLAERACSHFHQRSHRPVWLAASLGPYGAVLHNGAEYHGNYHLDHAALTAFHLRRIRALATTKADFLLFETVPSLDEARAIVAALAGAPDLAAAVSFACRDQQQTAHGEDIAACATMLEACEQVIAIGINCLAPRFVVPLVRRLRSYTTKKIAVYPNSGDRWDAAARSWSPSTPTSTAEAPEPVAEWRTLARKWRDAGADWIGGCCRTGPDHIRAVRAALGN
jgi:homocysteine S-methyltransferase